MGGSPRSVRLSGRDCGTYFGLGHCALEPDQAPGGARRLPRSWIGARSMLHHDLERSVAHRAELAHQLRQLFRLVHVDREEPVPADGTAERRAPGPAARHPDWNARLLDGPGLELALPEPGKALEALIQQPRPLTRLGHLAERLPPAPLIGPPRPPPRPAG